MSGIGEIKQIMEILGRNITEGNVRGSHLGTILGYLHRVQMESWKDTLSKLSLMCGMQQRYIRENYLEGLVAFGVIRTTVIKNSVFWKWEGVKAFNSDETFMDFVEKEKAKEKREEKKQKEEKKRGKTSAKKEKV